VASIGLDTNILVRYLAKDDEGQLIRARAVILARTKEDPAFISLVTLAELVWVLERSYKASKAEILKILEMLLRTEEFVIENQATVQAALKLFAASNADFADCLIERSSHEAGCDYTATFDEQAAKFAGMRLA
jgi:predicted nucleic-acid-binding protein